MAPQSATFGERRAQLSSQALRCRKEVRWPSSGVRPIGTKRSSPSRTASCSTARTSRPILASGSGSISASVQPSPEWKRGSHSRPSCEPESGWLSLPTQTASATSPASWASDDCNHFRSRWADARLTEGAISAAAPGDHAADRRGRREIASLVGVAPFAKDSGRKTGQRRIKAGRSAPPQRALFGRHERGSLQPGSQGNVREAHRRREATEGCLHRTGSEASDDPQCDGAGWDDVAAGHARNESSITVACWAAWRPSSIALSTVAANSGGQLPRYFGQ